MNSGPYRLDGGVDGPGGLMMASTSSTGKPSVLAMYPVS